MPLPPEQGWLLGRLVLPGLGEVIIAYKDSLFRMRGEGICPVEMTMVTQEEARVAMPKYHVVIDPVYGAEIPAPAPVDTEPPPSRVIRVRKR